MIGTTISHYEILDKIGEGGMGIVYKAKDNTLGRTVALKFLPQNIGATEEQKERFLREARAASAINHPNVCTIYGVEQQEEGVFISMEYVDGKSVATMVIQGPLEEKKVLRYAVQIAQGLAEAHDKGIIHRDVKCDNVMINSRNQAKVMDFGLARIDDSHRLTKQSAVLGSLAYMSPEQIQGGDLDFRTDIWSFGVLLYEMLTGTLPFSSEVEAALMYTILNVDPPFEETNVSEDMKALLASLLQKDRNERPSSMDSVIGVLQAIERGQHVQSAPIPRPGKSIAVLPLANLSPDPGNEFFSDGITEEIGSLLSRVKQLKVCSRSLAQQYKGQAIDPRKVGKDLGVQCLVEGSVRRIGNRVRLNIELTDARSGFQVWSHSYDRQIEDVFAVQDEVARTIVDALKLQITGDDQAALVQKYKSNAEAYDEYLRGKHMFDKRHREGLMEAIKHYRRAIEIDKNYALAYTGLALCYSALANYAWMDVRDGERLGTEALNKAVDLEPGLDEVHAVQGEYLFTRGDLSGAARHYEQAIDSNPSNANAHHWFAFVHLCRGDFENALKENSEGLRLEPLYLIISAYRGFIHFCQGNHELACTTIGKAIEIDSTFGQGHHLRAWTLAWMDRYDEALESVSQAEVTWGKNNQLLGVTGVINARKGDTDGAREILARFREKEKKEIYVHPYDKAIIQAALGEADQMFESLQRAVDIRFYWWFVTIKVHPLFEPYREDARFREILASMKLQ